MAKTELGLGAAASPEGAGLQMQLSIASAFEHLVSSSDGRRDRNKVGNKSR